MGKYPKVLAAISNQPLAIGHTKLQNLSLGFSLWCVSWSSPDTLSRFAPILVPPGHVLPSIGKRHVIRSSWSRIERRHGLAIRQARVDNDNEHHHRSAYAQRAAARTT